MKGISFANDKITFVDDEKKVLPYSSKWKVMIVDDEADVHTITKLILKDVVFDDKSLEFVSAYSGLEALQLITEHKNTALIFLDVVMEEHDTGLQVVKEIRENIGNKSVRIIIRTGQPGYAPDKDVVIKYDINDYKTKDELTHSKLFVTTIAALRAYRDIKNIDNLCRNLDSMVEKRTSQLLESNKQLKLREQQIVQSEKLAVIGVLAAGLAHEINNPLGFVNANVGNLGKFMKKLLTLVEYCSQLDLPDEIDKELAHKKEEISYDYLRKRILDIIESSKNGISRIKDIVLTLKDFSKVDSPECNEAFINDEIETTLKLLVSQYNDRVEIIKDYGSVPPIMCNAAKLNQVFMSILLNACQAINGEGKITIKTYEENGFVCIDISDTGTGIPEGVINKIFDPFFTTKPVGDGTGLGLSISRQIITEHRGYIFVDSTPNVGTTFSIKLPVDSTH